MLRISQRLSAAALYLQVFITETKLAAMQIAESFLPVFPQDPSLRTASPARSVRILCSLIGLYDIKIYLIG